MEGIFFIVILLFSVVLHELAHGFVAQGLGDPTAKNAGRLTLNPISHIDPIGSVLLPFLMYVLGSISGGRGIIFGWARPVPVNPSYFKNPRLGMLKVALAGPISNLAIAGVFGILARFGIHYASGFAPLYGVFAAIAQINIVLAVFNLLPIPPLDGSHVLFGFLPVSFDRLREFLTTYGFIILLFILFSPFNFISPLVSLISRFLLGSLLF